MKKNTLKILFIGLGCFMIAIIIGLAIITRNSPSIKDITDLPFIDEYQIDTSSSINYDLALDNVEAIENYGNYDIVIEQVDNNFGIKVMGDATATSNFIAEVSNKELILNTKSQNRGLAGKCSVEVRVPKCEEIKNYGISSIQFSITDPSLELEIENNGVGSINLTNTTAKEIDIENNGVGAINATNTNAQRVEIENEGVGAIAMANLNCDEIKISNNGTGKIALMGSCKKIVSSKNKGVGTIDISGLKVEE
ncbi:MAG: DUF2807 domain-containing protein [Bacteroidales bacterium]|nr:DUF2807 domain-containing protein [Bacteroidales bacterium]